MIKLTLPAKPKELTQEVEVQLVQEYKADKKKAVWQKGYIKDALNKMTNSKCAYSELKLNVEGKDMQIEHFRPKSKYPNLVVSWGNLLPSCNICNRSKGSLDEDIVNPLFDNPKEFLFIQNSRYYPVDGNIKGKKTCKILDLNNMHHLQSKRFMSAEHIYTQLCLANEKLLNPKEDGDIADSRNAIRQALELCTSEYEFSASLSTNILYERPDNIFKLVEDALREKDLWDEDFDVIKTDMLKCAMPK